MFLFAKIRKTLSFIKHRRRFINCDSYYPECKHKASFQIIEDQLFFIWKYGDFEPFYFTYGFDRKEMTREKMEEYIIPYNCFQRQINHLNFQNPRYDDFHGKMTGRVITGDKFYFNVFLERFGIPTPKVFLFIKDKRPLFFDPRFGVDPSLSVDAQLYSFFSHDMDAFAKPSDGQLGNGVFSLQIIDGKVLVNGKEMSVDSVISMILSADYLIQERVYQYPRLSELNRTSINSIRLQTVMDKYGVVHPFGAGLRIGRSGSTIDNWAKGGVFVGIDMDDGMLMNRGFMKPQYGTSVTEHPDTHMVFKGFKVPFFKEAQEMAVKLHSYLYRSHSVGWDIAITEKGPVFIEGNGLWEISLVQAVHGGMKKEIAGFFESGDD